MKKQRGITLIALVITIVVLFILAGVSLSLVLGDNGVLNKAQNATTETRKAEEKEKIEMAVAAARAVGNGALTTENLNTELDKIFNNGKEVKETNVRRLPQEYQEVEYIESTGTQYIDTKYRINQNFKYKLKYVITDTRSAGNIWPMLMGAYGLANASDGKNYVLGYTTPIERTDSYIIKNVELMLGKTIVDGEERENNKVWKGDPSNTVFLFNVYTSDQRVPNAFYSFARVYHAQVFDGDFLMRNLIPCYSTTTVTDVNGKQCSENTIGLYDLVEGKFYINQGTGEFLKGKDIIASDIPEWNYEIDENRKYIISNDGKVEQIIVEKKEILLPSEYQQVEYIESTGTQYIDTNYRINENYVYKMRVAIMDERSPNIEVYPQLIGAYGISYASDGKNYTIGYSHSNKKILGYEYKLKEIINVESRLGQTVVNGIEKENTKTWSGDPFSTVCLFNVRTSNTGISNWFNAIARIYFSQIFDGNTLIRDMIPCYSKTTVTDVNGKQCPANTKGMYDLVEGKFYTNQGTGDFIAGPDV